MQNINSNIEQSSYSLKSSGVTTRCHRATGVCCHTILIHFSAIFCIWRHTNTLILTWKQETLQTSIAGCLTKYQTDDICRRLRRMSQSAPSKTSEQWVLHIDNTDQTHCDGSSVPFSPCIYAISPLTMLTEQ